jgi:cell division protein FtsB
MTARRGSFRYKVTRLARAPLGRGAKSVAWKRRLTIWTRIASRIVSAAAAVFLVSAFGAQMWHVGAANYRLHKQIEAVERRNDVLSAESVKLARQVVLLHDPDFLVPLIHEQLGLVKPHEVFIVIGPTPAPLGK